MATKFNAAEFLATYLAINEKEITLNPAELFLVMGRLNLLTKNDEAFNPTKFAIALGGSKTIREAIEIDEESELDPVAQVTVALRTGATATDQEIEENGAAEVPAQFQAMQDQLDEENAGGEGGEDGEGETPDPGIPGDTFNLTTGADVLTPNAPEVEEGEEGEEVAEGVQYTTENDDTIIAEVAAKAKDSTLNAEDQIDGGAGNDTLQVSLENSFKGFDEKKGGFLKNVENIELTNNHAKGTNVDFDATGVEGATNYTVKDGVVNLKNLGKEATQVNLENIASGTQEIAHTEALAELNLGLNQVGSTATAVEVNSNAKSLVVTATDANNINLTASAAENLTVNGAGDLTLKAAATKLTSVDASELAGAANLTLTDSGELANLTTGAGDDTITVDAKALAVDAEIDGGAGNNTLVLTGSGTTMTYTLNNIQTLDATKLTGTTTFIGENVADVNTINLGGASGVTTNFYELENLSDLTLNINAKGKFTLDNAGETTINDAGAASGATLTLLEATDVTLNADKETNITLEAYAAESLTAQGTFGSKAKITVSEADEITLNQVAGKLKLNAATATQLTIDATTAGFEVASSSALNSLEELTIATKGASSKGVQFASKVTLDSLTELTLTGAGDIKLDALAANAGDSLTITANGINALTTGKIGGNVDSIEAEINARGAIKLGSAASQGIKATDSIELDIKTNGAISLGGGSSSKIEAKDIEITLNTTVASGTTLGLLKADDITLDVSKVINGVTFKGMEVGNSLEFIGAKNKENTFSSGSSSIEITGSNVTLDLTGGIKDDSFHIVTGSTATELTLTGDLGLGSSDSIIITASEQSAATVTLDLRDIENVDSVEITLGSNSATDVIKIGDNFAGLTGSGEFKITNFKGGSSSGDQIKFGDTALTSSALLKSSAASSAGYSSASKINILNFGGSSDSASYKVIIIGSDAYIDLDGDGIWNENNDLRITGIGSSVTEANFYF